MNHFDASDDEDEEDFLVFMEPDGDHVLTDELREAIYCASVVKFGAGVEVDIDEVFSEKAIRLSKSVVFHGPYTEEELEAKAVEAKQRQAVIVLPTHLWGEDEEELAWLACVSN